MLRQVGRTNWLGLYGDIETLIAGLSNGSDANY
jgi:hypothetical protein